MTVTLSPKTFLRKNIVEGVANAQFEQNLDFKDIFDVVGTEAVSVTYSEDVTTAGDDISSGVMGTPLDLGELSELTTIEVSPITQKAGMLRPFGFQIKVSKRDMRRSEVVDDLNRAVSRGTFNMAKKFNDDVISKLQNTTNDITEVDGTAVWSADTANPIGDIIKFQEAMDLEGWNAQLTDLFVNKTNFYEALNYMVELDRSYALDPTGNRKTLPAIMGTVIHNSQSTQLSEGSYLGIDRRPGFKPMTTYAYRAPEYENKKEFPIITVHQYEEEKHPHNLVTEFVGEVFNAVKVPNHFCYKSSGI